MLKISHINKFYSDKQVLHDISFEIPQGHAVGFVGPNGAGKSTTMNIITGYLSPTSGSVEIDGTDQEKDLQGYKSKFGYLPEVPPLYMDMVVYDYLSFVYDAKKIKGNKKEELERVMNRLQIGHVRGRIIKHLSKGYKQRIGFAQALLGSPPVLILDEPTIGLDPGQIIEIRNLLLDLKKEHTILISSHILSELSEVCDEIVMINEGHLMAYGKPSELIDRFCTANRCEICISGHTEQCISSLKAIDGIISCTETGSGEKSRYCIEYEKGKDIRSEIAAVLIKCGASLYEIKKTEASLEDVFLKLVSEPKG